MVGRSLSSLKLSDDQLGWKFARAIFHALNASDRIAVLDLSENNVSFQANSDTFLVILNCL